MNTEIIASHSKSSAQLLQTQKSFISEVIGKNRTQNKSWRSGACTENTETLSMHSLYTAPAFLFTRRKSRITNNLINIARQMSSFGGTAAQEVIGGIKGNIDAFKGWRIRNNEGKWAKQTAEITAIENQNPKEPKNTLGTEQGRIQQFAPALLFSAINNHILFAEVSEQ